MYKSLLVSALTVLCTASGAFAAHTGHRGHHAAPRTVEQMYCSEAVDYVAKNKRYWKETADGAIPLWPITPVSGTLACAFKEVFTYHVVKTLDRNDCLVGYTCHSGW